MNGKIYWQVAGLFFFALVKFLSDANPVIAGPFDEAKINVTKAQVKTIDTAITAYFIRNGIYPKDLNVLVGKYLKNKTAIRDAWKQPFHYRKTENGFLLWTVHPKTGQRIPPLEIANRAKYLTKEGKLTNTLEIKDVQGGFAGFTGKLWKVQPDGTWTRYQVFNQKLTKETGGKLLLAELEEFAFKLSEYDLLKLKEYGNPTTNPHVITVTFGKHKAQLIYAPGKNLPKPKAGKSATSVERYSGVVMSVRALRSQTGKKK